MARSILIPCGGCGYENFPQHRFCGMCGFPLPETSPGDARQPKPTASTAIGLDEFMAPVSSGDRVDLRPAVDRSEPAAQRNSAPPQISSSRRTEFDHPVATRGETPSSSVVSGPSFLGLAVQPNSDRECASYLLEDEQSASHPGRFALLLILLIAVALGASVWHWRQQFGGLSDRLLGRASQTSPQTANTSSITTSPSSDSSQATPPDATKAATSDTATTPSQSAPVQNGQAAATANSVPSAAPTPSPAAATPAPPDQTTVTSEPSTPAAKDQPPAATSPTSTLQSDDGSSAEKTMRQEDAAKAARAARKASPVPVSSPAPLIADSTEAEGEKYLYGTGVPQNCDRARKSLMAAASRADAKAQSVLGTMYATGHCAPRDLPLAYKWFAKALHQDPNNDRLSQDLRVLWNQMTPDERQLALRNE